MNKAQAAHDQCVRKFLACADRNPDGGTAGCDNCDALDAAGWKAIQALADFDAKQGARQR